MKPIICINICLCDSIKFQLTRYSYPRNLKFLRNITSRQTSKKKLSHLYVWFCNIIFTFSLWVLAHMIAIRVVLQCGEINLSRPFGGKQSLHLGGDWIRFRWLQKQLDGWTLSIVHILKSQTWWSEDTFNIFLRNTDTNFFSYMMQ